MDQTSSDRIDEGALTKGQLRKLNALRKSVGEEVGERAFAAWLESQGVADEKADGNAALVVDTLWPLIEQAPWRSRAAATSSDAGAGGSLWRRRGRSLDGRPWGPDVAST